jgi:hypothetical protein
MTTLNAQVNQCAGLLGTKDITEWEEEFLQSVIQKTGNGHDTRSLTEKQIECLERIYNKHFAG